MAQQLRSFAAFAGRPSLVPSTYTKKLITTCNTSSREPKTLFLNPEIQGMCVVHTLNHVHKISKIK